MLKNSVPLDKAIDEANALQAMAYVITEIKNSFESAEKWDKEADKFSARAINNQRDADDRKRQAGECRIEAGKALIRARTMLQESRSNLSWAQFCKAHIPRSDGDIRRVMRLAGADDPEAAAEAARVKNAEDQRRSRANRRTDNAPVSPNPEAWKVQADKVITPAPDAPPVGETPPEAPAAVSFEASAPVAAPEPSCLSPVTSGDHLPHVLDAMPHDRLLAVIYKALDKRNDWAHAMPLSDRTDYADKILWAIGVSPTAAQKSREEKNKGG